jgi:WD40 repeat protein
MNGGSYLRAVAFAANGEHLVSGGRVRVWRVEDGKQMAAVTVEAGLVQCLAVSNDGRWTAAGTKWGNVIVLDAKTHEKVFSHREDRRQINGVDFSPDSTRLVSASDNRTASIWDIATRKRVQTLDVGGWVTAAKYSPQGDRIATATGKSVRVWDSDDGRLLVDIPVGATSWYNTGLLWFNNFLFVVSDEKIKQIEASTGSLVSEWRVPDSNWRSCIALPKHAGFIACSTWRGVTFWDPATHTQLGLIERPQAIRSIAVSPDNRFLAIGGEGGKITINSLSRVTVSTLSRWIMVHMNNFLAPINFPCDSIPLSHIYPTLQEAGIRLDNTVLHSSSAQALRQWAKATLVGSEWKEQLGDTAVDAQRYDLAISHYSLALSLNPPSPQSILIKRGKAHLETGSWKHAVDDANQVHHCCLTEFILVDPSSSGNHTRSVVAMGLRDKACSVTQGRRL